MHTTIGLYTAIHFLIGMVEYLKIVKGDYFHWRTDCPNYPIKGIDTILTFKKRPSHLQPCPKCQKLEDEKGSE